MEKLHNPVGHQCASVLCGEDGNQLEILPDLLISQIWACEIKKLS